jgi:hypothetical protein
MSHESRMCRPLRIPRGRCVRECRNSRRADKPVHHRWCRNGFGDRRPTRTKERERLEIHGHLLVENHFGFFSYECQKLSTPFNSVILRCPTRLSRYSLIRGKELSVTCLRLFWMTSSARFLAYQPHNFQHDRQLLFLIRVHLQRIFCGVSAGEGT